MVKIISIVKNGVRYDFPWRKQEPIATDEPVISEGAIVTSNGHKGKVLDVTGDMASVSWEDASISEVPIKDLKYEGRVEKLAKEYEEAKHPRGPGGKWTSGGGEGGKEKTESFMSSETRFPHPKGAEAKLNEYQKKYPLHTQLLADAFNRGWNPSKLKAGDSAPYYAREFLRGPKGYKADAKEEKPLYPYRTLSQRSRDLKGK